MFFILVQCEIWSVWELVQRPYKTLGCLMLMTLASVFLSLLSQSKCSRSSAQFHLSTRVPAVWPFTCWPTYVCICERLIEAFLGPTGIHGACAVTMFAESGVDHIVRNYKRNHFQWPGCDQALLAIPVLWHTEPFAGLSPFEPGACNFNEKPSEWRGWEMQPAPKDALLYYTLLTSTTTLFGSVWSWDRWSASFPMCQIFFDADCLYMTFNPARETVLTAVASYKVLDGHCMSFSWSRSSTRENAWVGIYMIFSVCARKKAKGHSTARDATSCEND